MYGVPSLVLVILLQVFFTELSREYQSTDRGGAIACSSNSTQHGRSAFLFIALGTLSWIGMARLARGQVLAYREKEFVEAARAVAPAIGASSSCTWYPTSSPADRRGNAGRAGYIFTEAFLSFIGLGVQPGTPSWGAMISEVRNRGGFFSNRFILIVPSVALVLTAAVVQLSGRRPARRARPAPAGHLGAGRGACDRDAFDPRFRRLAAGGHQPGAGDSACYIGAGSRRVRADAVPHADALPHPGGVAPVGGRVRLRPARSGPPILPSQRLS